MSGTDDGLAGQGTGDFGFAQQQLNDLSAASRQMRSDMASGQFTIEPDAARKAAKACRDQIHRIDGLLGEVGGLGHRVNFGRCQVGEQLSQKFADKATGSNASLESLLKQSRTVLENLAKNYDEAARSYEHTDADASTALSRRAE